MLVQLAPYVNIGRLNCAKHQLGYSLRLDVNQVWLEKRFRRREPLTAYFYHTSIGKLPGENVNSYILDRDITIAEKYSTYSIGLHQHGSLERQLLFRLYVVTDITQFLLQHPNRLEVSRVIERVTTQ